MAAERAPSYRQRGMRSNLWRLDQRSSAPTPPPDPCPIRTRRNTRSLLLATSLPSQVGFVEIWATFFIVPESAVRSVASLQDLCGSLTLASTGASGECELKPGDRVRVGLLEFEVCIVAAPFGFDPETEQLVERRCFPRLLPRGRGFRSTPGRFAPAFFLRLGIAGGRMPSILPALCSLAGLATKQKGRSPHPKWAMGYDQGCEAGFGSEP